VPPLHFVAFHKHPSDVGTAEVAVLLLCSGHLRLLALLEMRDPRLQAAATLLKYLAAVEQCDPFTRTCGELSECAFKVSCNVHACKLKGPGRVTWRG
jgi:hypothetical protein